LSPESRLEGKPISWDLLLRHFRLMGLWRSTISNNCIVDRRFDQLLSKWRPFDRFTNRRWCL